MKRLFLFTTFLLAAVCSFGQTYELRGKVTKNGKTLPGVDISVKDSSKGTTTDLEGRYRLQLSKGKHLLIFSYGGTKTVAVTIRKDQTLNVDMTKLSTKLSPVFISALRVDADSPITHDNMGHREIQSRNLGQDIPILMNYMTNVVTTSDAGAGVGYTGIRIRGSDASRTNVTLNGIPLNDSESQGVFWVDLGDFTSSVQDLQLQRGVGASTNGAGAFGASINVKTNRIHEKPGAEITNTYGSFATHKHQLKFNTGLLDNHFAFSGNFSLLKSDGYRDRAFSNLKSYFLQGLYQNKHTQIKVLGFGGTEKTYQAYYGITRERLNTDRTFNPAGMYTDSTGQTHFYKNQTDNYKQDHLQVIWQQQYNRTWSSKLAFFYTYGRGYYESYHQDADLQAYGLPYFSNQGAEVTTSDLVSQKWLSNHFYGITYNFTYHKNGIKALLGGDWNKYSGRHYGTVVYTQFAKNDFPFDHYYNNFGYKTDFNIYGKATIALTDKLMGFGDLQLRTIHYHTSGPYEGQVFAVSDAFTFFNPKIGLTYRFNPKHQLYVSYGRAHKEPGRGDYKSAVLGQSNPEYPKAESLNDFELGWRYQSRKMQFSANLYYMDYHNQLVLTGAIDPEGRFIRKNSGSSYRYGLEVSADITVTPTFHILPNFSWSQNENIAYKATINGAVKNYGDTEISFSPSLVAGNKLRYRLLENLYINFLTKFVGKQYLSNTEAKDSQLDSYLLNGLNIQYRWQSAPFFKAIVFKGLVNNIFNEKYISNGYYSPASGPLYYPQAGINFLAGITLKF